MAEVKLKDEHNYCSALESPIIKQEPEEAELRIKQEPQEFPFNVVIVKSEYDDDTPSVLHQSPTEKREEMYGEACGTEAGCSSDPLIQFHSDCEEQTDSSDLNSHSEDWVHGQIKASLSSASQFHSESEESSDSSDHTDYSEDWDHKQTKATCSNSSQFDSESEESTDDSEDYSDEEALAKRSYAMIPPDSCVTDCRTFSCAECEKSFKWNVELKRHMEGHTERKIIKDNYCSICEKTFAQCSNLKKHMKIHTGEKPSICPICEKGFGTNSNLSRHQVFVHHICPVCSKGLTDRNSLGEHLKTHVVEGIMNPSSNIFREIVKPSSDSDYRRFSCLECGRTFNRKANLKQHMSVHMPDHRPFSCLECGKTFKRNAELKPHMSVHRPDHRPFSCLECGKSFKRKADLKPHMSVHTKVKRQKNYKCSVCEKTFGQRRHFKVHMKSHTGQKLFICSVCDRGFVTNSHLTRHQIFIHHICLVCSKGFSDRNSLGDHLKTHVDEGTLDQSSNIFREIVKPSSCTDHRPFSCPECGKSFRWKSRLQNHMLLHKEEKPHKCTKCGKSFRWSSHLQRHLSGVHREGKNEDIQMCLKSENITFQLLRE